jgi:hypothetical protein
MHAKLIIAFWISFAASAILYVVMVAWSLPRISAMANGMIPFDLRPTGYGLEEAKSFVAALSEEGRKFYLLTQHNLDTVYPPLLAITLALGMWIMSPLSSLWLRVPLIVVPLLAMVSDLVENHLVREMLKTPSQTLDAELVMMASTATVFKSVLTSIAMCVLLGFTVLWAWNKWRRA